MARPKKPEKLALSAPVRSWFRRAEAAALGRHARVKGKTISTFVRDTVLAAIAADTANDHRSVAR